MPLFIFAGENGKVQKPAYEDELRYYGLSKEMMDGSLITGEESITTEDLQNIIVLKGMETVTIVKTIALFSCIIGFIISCVMSISAVLFGEHSLFRSILGAMIAGIAYALITDGEKVAALFLNLLKP